MKCEDRAKLTLRELLITLGSMGKFQFPTEYASISAACLFPCPFLVPQFKSGSLRIS